MKFKQRKICEGLKVKPYQSDEGPIYIPTHNYTIIVLYSIQRTIQPACIILYLCQFRTQHISNSYNATELYCMRYYSILYNNNL